MLSLLPALPTFRQQPLRTLTRMVHTSPTLFSSSSDTRPASSRLFPPSLIQSSVDTLTSQRYDPSTIWEQRVVWGDHDQFQHVNNVHYVKWVESARMFFFEQISSGQEFTDERKDEIVRGTGKSVILASINVRYRRPVTYPDTILIAQAAELPLGKDRLNIKAVAFSVKQQTIVAISNQDCVSYDYQTLKKCEIPQDLKQALERKGIPAEDKTK